MQVHEVLNKAADILERDGWCQRSGRGESGERCSTSAISDATPLGDDLTFHTARRVFQKYVWRNHAEVKLVYEWNDEPERTKEQVIDALRACARENAPLC